LQMLLNPQLVIWVWVVVTDICVLCPSLGLRFRVQGSGFRVQDSGFRV